MDKSLSDEEAAAGLTATLDHDGSISTIMLDDIVDITVTCEIRQVLAKTLKAPEEAIGSDRSSTSALQRHIQKSLQCMAQIMGPSDSADIDDPTAAHEHEASVSHEKLSTSRKDLVVTSMRRALKQGDVLTLKSMVDLRSSVFPHHDDDRKGALEFITTAAAHGYDAVKLTGFGSKNEAGVWETTSTFELHPGVQYEVMEISGRDLLFKVARCEVMAATKSDASKNSQSGWLAPSVARLFVHDADKMEADRPNQDFTQMHKNTIASLQMIFPPDGVVTFESRFQFKSWLQADEPLHAQLRKPLDYGENLERLVLADRAAVDSFYGARTPHEYGVYVAQDKESAIKVRHVEPCTADAHGTGELFTRWQHGKLIASEPRGLGSLGFVSTASKGVRTCACEDGVAITSMPGFNQTGYNHVFRICLQANIDFNVVWEAEWGNMWFFMWLRNVIDSVLTGRGSLWCSRIHRSSWA